MNWLVTNGVFEDLSHFISVSMFSPMTSGLLQYAYNTITKSTCWGVRLTLENDSAQPRNMRQTEPAILSYSNLSFGLTKSGLNVLVSLK